MFRRSLLRDSTGQIPLDWWKNARQQRASMMAARLAAFGFDQPLASQVAGIRPDNWAFLGPNDVGGRVVTLAVHPQNAATILAGTNSGGIFRSTDAGASWAPVQDFLPGLTMSSIAFNPSDGNEVYAASTFREGVFNGYYRSADAGVTWTPLDASNVYQQAITSKLVVVNPGAVLAATWQGVFRSSNHGDSWSQVLVGDFSDLRPGISNPALIMATGPSGVFRSLDAGASWQASAGAHIPPGGRALVTISSVTSPPADVVYVWSGNVLSRSHDSGFSFSPVSGAAVPEQPFLAGGAFFSYPNNSQMLVVGGTDLHRSVNGGVSWTKISNWNNARPNSSPQQWTSVHADHLSIAPDPGFNGTTNVRAYFGTDGGVFRADNVGTVSENSGWTAANTGLANTEFYHGAGAAGNLLGGAQDNGTLRESALWDHAYGGDGGYVAIDATRDIRYMESQNLGLHRRVGGGNAVAIAAGISDVNSCAGFIAPFVLDSNDPERQRMIAGTCSVWLTSNVRATAPTWSRIRPSEAADNFSTAIAVKGGDSNEVWVGYFLGLLVRTTNALSGNPSWQVVSGGLPSRQITSILLSGSRTYVSFAGLGPNAIMRSDNNGASWISATGSGNTGLPQVPVRTLAVHPQNPDWLYAGTQIGIFASEDGGATWAVSQAGPATVQTTRLYFEGDDLYAFTHGRGIWRATIDAGVSGLGAAAPISPSGCTTNGLPTLNWAAVSGATSYRLKVKLDSLLVVDEVATGTSLPSPENLPQGNYTWTVQARSGSQQGDESAPLAFDVTASCSCQSTAQNFTVAVHPYYHTTVTFSANLAAVTPNGPPVLWDFGDGVHSSGAEVTHVYLSGGSKVVRMTSNDAGCHETVVTPKTIYLEPSASCSQLAAQNGPGWTFECKSPAYPEDVLCDDQPGNPGSKNITQDCPSPQFCCLYLTNPTVDCSSPSSHNHGGSCGSTDSCGHVFGSPEDAACTPATCSDMAGQSGGVFVGCATAEHTCQNYPGASPVAGGAECLSTACCVTSGGPPDPCASPSSHNHTGSCGSADSCGHVFGSSYDCQQSCGGMGGDYCSQTPGYCPGGYTNLGSSAYNGAPECAACCDWTCQSNGCPAGEYGWQADNCGTSIYCGDACDSPNTHDHWGNCGGTDSCGHSFGSDADCGCANTPWEWDMCDSWSCQEGWSYTPDYCTGTNYSCDWIESCWTECGMVNYDEWSCWDQCGGYWGNCQESSYQYECGGHYDYYQYGCYNQPYACNWRRCGW